MYYLLIVLYYLKTILKVLIFLSLLACMFSVAKPNFFVCLKMFSVGGIHKPCWQGGREGGFPKSPQVGRGSKWTQKPAHSNSKCLF